MESGTDIAPRRPTRRDWYVLFGIIATVAVVVFFYVMYGGSS